MERVDLICFEEDVMQCECGYNGEPAQRSVISEEHSII
jgi:hypothetical protein